MSFWDAISDAGGELVGGVMGAAGDLADGWVDNKLTDESSAAASANPDEAKSNQVSAQQPNGAPLPSGGAVNNQTLMYVGMGTAAVLSVVLIAMALRK